MKEIKAPESFTKATRPFLFLAGSIEMGAAENWQTRITQALGGFHGTILNPRRDNWDSSWKQSIDEPQFYDQVTWELTAQEDADLIVFYFDPATKSPITLLELGLFTQASHHPAMQLNRLVCCPDGYWRKGNVQVVCQRYGVPLVGTMDVFIAEVARWLSTWSPVVRAAERP